MSPAIITPLSHEDYYVRFNKKSSSAVSIFLVQIMHPGKNLPYRCFVMLKVKRHWVVQWCEQEPASNYAYERMRDNPATPAHYWLKEDARVTCDAFEDILHAFCKGLPETILWQTR